MLAASVRGRPRLGGRDASTTPARGPPAAAPRPRASLLSALRRPVPAVAVVVDTSGSVDDALLGQALAEVDGTLQAGGVRREAVTVLAVDTAGGPGPAGAVGVAGAC